MQSTLLKHAKWESSPMDHFLRDSLRVGRPGAEKVHTRCHVCQQWGSCKCEWENDRDPIKPQTWPWAKGSITNNVDCMSYSTHMGGALASSLSLLFLCAEITQSVCEEYLKSGGIMPKTHPAPLWLAASETRAGIEFFQTYWEIAIFIYMVLESLHQTRLSHVTK